MDYGLPSTAPESVVEPAPEESVGTPDADPVVKSGKI